MTRIQIVPRLKDLNGVKAPSEIDKIHGNMKFSLMIQIELLQGLEGILKPI